MRVRDMLTNSEIKSLRHSGKKGADKHLDRDQLYLYVLPTGTKSWRLSGFCGRFVIRTCRPG